MIEKIILCNKIKLSENIIVYLIESHHNTIEVKSLLKTLMLRKYIYDYLK